jgi:Rps23 Pro-64 3,4-dihydroxylase Tpa1-like proline 4-hydroxylase
VRFIHLDILATIRFRLPCVERDLTIIDPLVLTRAQEISREYQLAKPFRHAVIDSFLLQDLCNDLLNEFPAFDSANAIGEIGVVQGKAVREQVYCISDAFRRLDNGLRGQDFLDFICEITGIPNLLFDPDYLGGGTHENLHGQNLAAHIDFNFHPRTRWHRRLNLIVYLNPEWDETWGGSLELHSNPWDPASDQISSVLPLLNRAIIFETNEKSWHGFPEICLPQDRSGLSRKSFALYLYTATRPEDEVALDHSTIYIPDGVPRSWGPGQVLTEADMADLDKRFLKVRRRLRYLYERETTFTAQVAAIEQELASTRAAVRLPLQGYAIQPNGCRGLWPDNWASAAVTATVMPTRSVSELRLEVWVPPQVGTEQEIQIQFGNETATRQIASGEVVQLSMPVTVSAGTQVDLKIRATHAWIPSADGSSADGRAIAYCLRSISLEHSLEC